MLDFIKSDKDDLTFSMTVSTSRKIDIYWNDIESELRSNYQCKQLVFIDPIVLSFFPELVNLELISLKRISQNLMSLILKRLLRIY